MVKERDINIVGICRFSMLGRGDWKAYRNQPEEALEAIYAQKAKELFDPQRLEARLATFEHLTLRSLTHQTDPNFIFLVISSDRIPDRYGDRLAQICATEKRVILRFVPPMHISDAIRMIAGEKGWSLPDTVQFRLDDDDCVSEEYIRRLRRHAAGMWRNGNFGISFSQQFYCITDGPTEGIYDWYSPFFSAGAAVRSAGRTVFDFGHYQIPLRMTAVTDPHFPNIVTHRGDNDTPRHAPETLRKRGMRKASPQEIQRIYGRHFDYLTDEGLALCKFDTVVTSNSMTKMAPPLDEDITLNDKPAASLIPPPEVETDTKAAQKRNSPTRKQKSTSRTAGQ
ncbi:putative rhamnosyl transferase [Paracoccus binzhouensis]|uniref:putative rhamnosyl transferase n=1 Tax=Paracoccus binzhouensis TaxID=2796149 RepID=UPI0018EEF753|nr:putative rhamnosyl transferase [Paracoccus binzhouensis]